MNTQKHIPIATPFADSILAVTDNFDGALSATEDTVQKALDVLDDTVEANTIHSFSDGTDHTFIDQDVSIGADVAFGTLTISDIIIDTGNANDILWDTTSAVNQSFTGTLIRDAGGASTVFQGRRARSGPASLNSGNQMVKLRALAWNSDITNYGLSGEITFSADGAHGGTDIPCQILVRLSPDESATARDVFRFRADGSIEMPLDDQYLKFGALNTDLQIGSDGTNGVINVNESLIINGTLGDTEIKALVVNSANSVNTGITLQGSGPIVETGGTIIWHSNGIPSEVGHNYLNEDYKLVFDTSAQVGAGDTGNAWIAFDTGDANFGIVTATEYRGGSPVRLREGVISFGEEDSAKIYLGEDAFGDPAWIFEIEPVTAPEEARIAMQFEAGFITINGFDAFEGQGEVNILGDTLTLKSNDKEDYVIFFPEGCEFGGRIDNLQEEWPIKFRDNTDQGFVMQVFGFAKEIKVDGTAYFGDGGVDDYIKIDSVGDVTFIGGGGLQLGEICYHDGGFTVVLAAQDTDYQVIGFNINGESNGDVVPDNTNDHLSIGKAGIYEIAYSVDVRSTTSNIYEFHVMYDNGTVDLVNSYSHRNTTVANKIGGVGFPFLASLPAGVTLEVWVRRIDGGAASKTITIERANLMAIQKAGKIAA